MGLEPLYIETGRRIQELRGNRTQAEFAALIGVDRKSVTGWETGKRLPDGASLFVMRRDLGADLNYLLGGPQQAQPALAEDERQLLALFRSAPLAVKAAAVGALQGAEQAGKSKAIQNFQNSPIHGDVAAGDMVKHNYSRGRSGGGR